MESAIATIIVGIIGLIGVIIQTMSHNKLDSQKELLSKVNKEILEFKKESKEDDQRLNDRLTALELRAAKRYLINEMTKIANNEYVPNEEQKSILKETKKVYNDRGGDSYVDDMYDDLREKKKI